MTTELNVEHLTRMTANIVSAYVTNNQIEKDQIPHVIGSVHETLARLVDHRVEPLQPELRPAVPIKKSVTPEYIICLEDGKRFKFLKRHLSAAFGMTPAEYRAKWKLPPTYPMIAPNYAAPSSRLDHLDIFRKSGGMIDQVSDGDDSSRKRKQKRTRLDDEMEEE